MTEQDNCLLEYHGPIIKADRKNSIDFFQGPNRVFYPFAYNHRHYYPDKELIEDHPAFFQTPLAYRSLIPYADQTDCMGTLRLIAMLFKDIEESAGTNVLADLFSKTFNLTTTQLMLCVYLDDFSPVGDSPSCISPRHQFVAVDPQTNAGKLIKLSQTQEGNTSYEGRFDISTTNGKGVLKPCLKHGDNREIETLKTRLFFNQTNRDEYELVCCDIRPYWSSTG